MSDEIMKLYQSIANKNSTSNQETKIGTESSNTNTKSVSAGSSFQRAKSENLAAAITSIKPVSFVQVRNVNTNRPLTTSTTQNESSFKRYATFNTFDNENSNFSTENSNMLKRKREKCSKGLRHFSMKVCEKVKTKRITTYNQVADELVREYCNDSPTSSSAAKNSSNIFDSMSYDQKNVRRRVYDALNVLMAMDIISKEKKEIKWIGLPTNKEQECKELEEEKVKRKERIKHKCDTLKNLLEEHVAIKLLIERNKSQQEQSSTLQQDQEKIPIPFVVLNTDSKTVVDFSISSDKKEYVVQFDNTFQITLHMDVLRKLGLTDFQKVCLSNSTSKLVPKMFEPYIEQLKKSQEIEPIVFRPDLPTYQNLSIHENTKKTEANNSKTANSVQNQKRNNSSLDEDESEKASENTSNKDQMEEDSDEQINRSNEEEENEDEEDEEEEGEDNIYNSDEDNSFDNQYEEEDEEDDYDEFADENEEDDDEDQDDQVDSMNH